MMKVKLNVPAPAGRRRLRRKRWKELYDAIEVMELDSWAQVTVTNGATDNQFRAAVSNAGRILGFRMSANKFETNVYRIGKFRKE
jgi:hypothetical protein